VETEDKGLVEIKGYYSPSPDCRKVKLWFRMLHSFFSLALWHWCQKVMQQILNSSLYSFFFNHLFILKAFISVRNFYIGI
jgi:hypothetical protein